MKTLESYKHKLSKYLLYLFLSKQNIPLKDQDGNYIRFEDYDIGIETEIRDDDGNPIYYFDIGITYDGYAIAGVEVFHKSKCKNNKIQWCKDNNIALYEIDAEYLLSQVNEPLSVKCHTYNHSSEMQIYKDLFLVKKPPLEIQLWFDEMKFGSVKKQRHWFVAYTDHIKEMENLSHYDVGAAFILASALMFNNKNYIMKDKNTYMMKKDIAKYISKEITSTKQILKKLKENKVIHAVTNSTDNRLKNHIINKKYFEIGKIRKGTEFVKVYKTTFKKSIKNVPVQCVGLLYKLLPFINDDSNSINLTLKEIGEYEGLTSVTIKNNLKRLEENDIVARKGRVIYINPTIITKKISLNDYSEENKKIFEELFDINF